MLGFQFKDDWMRGFFCCDEVIVSVCVCVSFPGFDLHRRQPRGVCRALLEPRPHQAGRGPSPPHRADDLRQRALPHRQGHLRHCHVVHDQQEGAACLLNWVRRLVYCSYIDYVLQSSPCCSIYLAANLLTLYSACMQINREAHTDLHVRTGFGDLH